MTSERHYPLYPVNRYETFLDMLNGIARQYGTQDVIVTYTNEGERQAYSFLQLRQDALAFAAALKAMGLDGQHTAIAGGNSYRYLVAMFGVVLAGGVSVPLDTEHTEDAIQRMLLRAEAASVICDDLLLPLFEPMRKRLLSAIIAMTGTGGDADFDGLVSAGALRLQMLPAWDAGPDERDRLSMIVFTSGTTSEQKPVMLSQKNLLTNACGAAAMVYVGERVFTPLPLYHTYGLTCGVLGHISQGRTVGLTYSLKHMLRDLKLFSPHTLTAVPLVAETLYMRTMALLKQEGKLEKAEAYFSAHALRRSLAMPAFVKAARDEVMGENLSLASCGGAHLNGRVLRHMDALGVQILEGYGITECGPMVTCNRNRAQRMDSAGLPLPDTEISFEDGEILVRGLGVSAGYYQNDALIAQEFSDGWFHTGDLGFTDADGYLYITGRKKNLIVFKNGKKVMPEEIEQYVSGIPLVMEAVAYGVHAGESDDDVQLALQVYPNPKLAAGMSAYEIMRTLEDEIQKVNSALPSYKQIQMIKVRDIPFEKTASKKIKRNIT